MKNISKQKYILFLIAISFILYTSVSFFSAGATTISNGMNAAYVIGAGSPTQNFSVGTSGLTSSILEAPMAVLYDQADQRIFVAERLNNRVLVFNTNIHGVPIDYVADHVLGQEDFTSQVPETDQDSLSGPESLAYDSENKILYVGDGPAWWRIMAFDVRPAGSVSRDFCNNLTNTTGIANGMNASCVIGQASFVAEAVSTSVSGIRNARGMDYDEENERLFVRDMFRVLIYDMSMGTTNGMNASFVLGQEDFTSEVSTTTRDGLRNEIENTGGVVYDRGHNFLYVTDGENSRILVFNVTPGTITNGEDALYVLGQSNFTSNVDVGLTAKSFWRVAPGGYSPIYFSEGSYDHVKDRLFVSNAAGIISVFDMRYGISDYMPASWVIGQSDFTTAVTGTSQNTFFGVGGSYFSPENELLYTADILNNRVLIFDLTPNSGGGPNPTYYVDPPQCHLQVADTIIEGSPLTLNWSVTWPGQFSSPYYYKLNGEIYSSEVQGVSLMPGDPLYPNPTQTFTLDAINLYGATTCEKEVEVVPPPPAETLSCTAQFNPSTIYLGEQSTLSWVTSGGVPPYDEIGETSPLTIQGEELGEFTHVVESSDSVGNTADCSADLNVVLPPEPTPLACSLFAAPSTLQSGQSTSLTWDIQGGSSPYLSYFNHQGYPIGEPYSYTPTSLPQTVGITIVDNNQNQATCSVSMSKILETPYFPPQAPNQPNTPTQIPSSPNPVQIPTDSPLIDNSWDTSSGVDLGQPQGGESEQSENSNGITFITTDLANFLSQTETKIGIAIALVIGLLSAISGAFAGALSASEIVLLPARLWNIFLTALGLRKKERPWGTVYDARTKQPLDPVYVILTNIQTGKEKTVITDMDGRYSFLIDEPGTYRITAKKSDYSFPSHALIGQSNDHLYKDLYFGAPFEVQKEGEVILKNIPLDPITINWNEQDKLNNNRLKFYKKSDYALTKLADLLFYAGFIFAIIALVISPEIYNIVIFILYILFAIIKKTGYGGRPTGEVVSAENNPIPYAILKLISPTLNQEIKHTVADKYGRYHMLANNGEYTLKVEEIKGEMVKNEMTKSTNITKGYLKERIRI